MAKVSAIGTTAPSTTSMIPYSPDAIVSMLSLKTMRSRCNKHDDVTLQLTYWFYEKQKYRHSTGNANIDVLQETEIHL